MESWPILALSTIALIQVIIIGWLSYSLKETRLDVEDLRHILLMSAKGKINIKENDYGE